MFQRLWAGDGGGRWWGAISFGLAIRPSHCSGRLSELELSHFSEAPCKCTSLTIGHTTLRWSGVWLMDKEGFETPKATGPFQIPVMRLRDFTYTNLTALSWWWQGWMFCSCTSRKTFRDECLCRPTEVKADCDNEDLLLKYSSSELFATSVCLGEGFFKVLHVAL